MPNIERIKSDWSVLRATGKDARGETPDHVDELITLTGQLGPLLRLHIILHALHLKGKSFAKNVAALGSVDAVRSKYLRQFPSGKTPPISDVQLYRYVQFNRVAPKNFDRHVSHFARFCILQLVNDKRAADNNKPDLTFGELFGDGLDGPDAVTRYLDLLEKRHAPLRDQLDLFGERRDLHFYRDGHRDRTDQLERLRRLIFDGSSSSQMLINPWAHGMWGGLTALAWELGTNKLGAEGQLLPVVYVPILLGAQHSHTSLSSIVSVLVAFYKGEPVVNARPIRRSSDLWAAVQWLRERMALQPCAILIDFYSAPECPAPVVHISRAVRDDQILQLITRLLDPPAGRSHDSVDIDLWRRNRIVVFSEAPLLTGSETGGLRHDLAMYDIAAVKIDPPLKADVRAILRKNDLPQLSRINVLRESWRTLNEETSESVFRTLDTLLALELGPRPPEDPAPKDPAKQSLRNLNADEMGKLNALSARLEMRRRSGGLERSAASPSQITLKAIVDEVLDQIAIQSPVKMFLLQAIALTPGGLQMTTMKRLLTTLTERLERTAGDDVAAVLGFEPDILGPDGSRAVDDIMTNFQMVLDGGYIDEFDTIEAQVRPHALLNDDPLLGRMTRTCSVDFTIPELRAAILRRLYRNAETRRRAHAIHRLLNDEAHNQQVEAFMVSRSLNGTSIRPYRRAISAIYHGLMSLTFDEKGELGSPALKLRGSVLPNDPVEAWLFLQLETYRRELQSPPTWAVDRVFGQNRLKAELLGLFEQPWLGWPASENEKQFQNWQGCAKAIGRKIEKLPSADRALKQANLRRIVADQFIARTIVRNRLASPQDHSPQEEPVEELEAFGTHERWRTRKQMIDDRLASFHWSLESTEAWPGASIEAEIKSWFEDFWSEMTNKAVKAEFFETIDASGIDMTTRKTGELFQSIGEANFGGKLGPSDFTASIRKWLGREKPEELRTLVDLLNRRAEVPAIRALLRDSDHALVNQLSAYVKKLPSNKKLTPQELAAISRSQSPRFPIESEETILADYCSAYAYFEVAEIVRQLAFEMDPHGTKHFVSGGATFTAIRVAIKLERWSRTRCTTPPDRPGRFANYAFEMSSLAARHLFRYNAERCRLLGIQATIARLRRPRAADRRSAAIDELQRARAYLREAEAISMGLDFDLRAQLELTLERIKLNREFALLVPDGHYKRMAEEDLKRLNRLARFSRSDLWPLLLELQEHRMVLLG